MKQKGFTLFELASVLVIIGVLSALVTFSWSDSSIRLTAQAQRLKTDIRYIQMLSMAEHKMYRINFVNSTQYSITESDGVTPVYFPGSAINTTTTDAGITLSSNRSPLFFNSFGTPFISTSIALTNNAVITFTTTDGSTSSVIIRPETGYASVS